MGANEKGSAAVATRYPGYDVLAKWSSPDWDDGTRSVVRARLEEVPPIRFFTATEAELLEAVARRIVPLCVRDTKLTIPIVPWIDDKLFHDRRDGYRYDTLPPQREAWRLGLSGIDATARQVHGHAFIELAAEQQDDVLSRIARGEALGDQWSSLPSARFFSVLTATVAKIYYAHPAAWSEIGYSGPSSPRGHVRNWMGGVDPWDAHEAAPRSST